MCRHSYVTELTFVNGTVCLLVFRVLSAKWLKNGGQRFSL